MKQGAIISTAQYRDWSQLKTNSVNLAIEKARMNLPLPTLLPNPFPKTYGFVDWTNKAIEDIQKRGRYLSMDELSNTAAPTSEMQDAIQESLSMSGGIIGAPAGFGKSFSFEYLGRMAAERSLSHTSLWFGASALIDPRQLKNSNIKEFHFMFAAAKIALAQTRKYEGTGEQALQEATEAVTAMPGRFVLCLDELYDALKTGGQNASQGWTSLKAWTDPDSLVKVIGTMASENVEKFKELKNQGGPDDDNAGELFYNPQMESRFLFKSVPDYTDDEQYLALNRGSLAAVIKAKSLPLKYSDEDKEEIVRILVEKTDDVERGKQPDQRKYAAPRKWGNILIQANGFVKNRLTDFSQLIMDKEYIRKTSDLSAWYNKLKGLENKKQEILSSKEEKIQPNVPAAGKSAPNAGLISFRDQGDKFPHELVETPEVVGEQKQQIVSDIDKAAEAVKADLQTILKKKRYIDIAVRQGMAKLNSQYGEGIFAEDLHDLGFLKPIDIERVDVSKVLSASAKEK